MAEATATAPVTLLYLPPADRASWRWWPVLRDRMRKTLPELDPDLPVEPIIGFICQQAMQAPATVRWWLAVHEEDIVGHAVAWVDISWGEPYILVHQLVADTGLHVLLPDWLADLKVWSETLNIAYEQSRSPLRIREIRFWTARADAPWDRLLSGLVSKTFHVKHIPLSRLDRESSA